MQLKSLKWLNEKLNHDKHRSMKSKIIFFVLILLSHFAFSDNKALIEKANSAYTSKKYEEAADLYKQVLKNNYESWEVYYNLGNASFKSNEIPSAILNYEKALKLNPGNDDIVFNLKIANTKIADKFEQMPVLFYKRWWNNICNFFSADGWGIVTILFFLFFLFLLSVYFFSKNIVVRKFSFYTCIVFFLFSLIAFALGFKQYSMLKNESQAIVFTPTLTVKGGPDESNSDLFVIHEGTKVRIIDKVNKWYRIQIADGNDGWIPSDKVEII